jgi:hypothetical protein
MSTRRRIAAFMLVLVATAVALGAEGAQATPIPSAAPSSLPGFSGAAFSRHPTTATRPPQNPFMARNPKSNIHNDTWMTDAYRWDGPLGHSLQATSRSYNPSLCGSVAFDTHGNIVTVCPSTVAPPQARIINARTLAPIATYDLPQKADPPGTEAFQNFTGGGYFVLDERNQLLVATKTGHILRVGETADGKRLVKRKDYDLTSVLASDERVTSALPDFDGNIWFVSKKSGKIGTISRKTGRIRMIRLGEEIENSFAVDRGAIYIVSDKRMYRFSATAKGTPKVDWKVTYANSGIRKPSQVDAGSGTTPTIMAGGYVAITDNADPMNVVVYRKATHLRRGQKRVVCEVPVFRKGASATENSLITAGRSLIVENNYGYQDPFGPKAGALTEPGVTRVDVNAKGTGCRTVWRNRTERAPTVVPKLSTGTGLMYLYTRDKDPNGSQPWFWTAIDFRTGKTVWKKLAGTGPSYNNNYAGLAIGPDKTAYLGTIGGMLALRDK